MALWGGGWEAFGEERWMEILALSEDVFQPCGFVGFFWRARWGALWRDWVRILMRWKDGS